LSHIPYHPDIEEVILVDGHSRDRTLETARRIYPDIKVMQQTGYGKGNAIVCGAQAAIGDYFLVLDADGSQLPEEIPGYIEEARFGYDLVKGSRYMAGGYSEERTWDRQIITQIAQFIANKLWHTDFSDICFGMFLIKRKKFLELNIQAQRHDVEWEIMAKAKRYNFTIVEVPSYEAKRISGRSHISYFRDGWLIARTIFRQFQENLKSK
jgi:glycosyltransferase involved in cell wall biosynthesis